MRTPARPSDIRPDAISVPSGLQVYTHPRPDGGLCQSAWAQHTCSCGAYALTWETPAMAWGGHGRGPLDWKIIPDNQGVIAILAEAIDGPYRFAHNALSPYVTVSPSTPDQPITIAATDRLALKGRRARRHLRGLEETMTFAVMLDRPDERLVEVGTRALPTRPKKAPPIAPREVPLPQSLAAPPTPLKRPPSRLVVAPPDPPPVDAPIPALIAAVCHAEDVHPELGDYVVIPKASVPESEPLPRWAVRYDVDRIRIVKPRLGVDRPFGGEA